MNAVAIEEQKNDFTGNHFRQRKRIRKTKSVELYS